MKYKEQVEASNDIVYQILARVPFGIIVTQKGRNKSESVYKEKMMQNVTHELRTPTNAIIMMIRQLVEHFEFQEIMPKVREWLEIANCSSEMLLCLINYILDSAKIEKTP